MRFLKIMTILLFWSLLCYTQTIHYDFTYSSRASILADGWDFIAITPAGSSRNTEQTSGAVVSYDQQAHPGVLRIPVDMGDLWAGLNNTRNTLFRDLPSDWTSVRLKVSSFAPTRNYQQAGLVVYENDNNYVQIMRIYEAGNSITFVRETGGNASNLNVVSVSATSNLYFRLDRDLSTGVITSYYSLNGTNWTTVGSVTQTISNPRLGIVIGGDNSPGTYPNADIAWVEVYYNEVGLKNTRENFQEIIYEFPDRLYQNYPNPFKDYTWIEYDLTDNCNVILELYNAFGQKIKTVLNQNMESGSHRFILNASTYPSGIYYLILKTELFNSTIKLSIIK